MSVVDNRTGCYDRWAMRRSELFLKTQKLSPRDEPSINAQLLLRAGFIDKLMAGSYTFLPLGQRVLANIEQVVREEMNRLGAQETLMPLLHPKEVWHDTGRWESAKEVMYQLEKDGKEFGLSFTHEEVVMDVLKKRNISYKDLPLGLYQFSNKFRNEPRSRSGLLRGIEFRMKDLYSVHAAEKDMQHYYVLVLEAYKTIFNRLGVTTKVVEAAGGVFTNSYTHEFQVLADAGEDTIYYCTKCDWAQNKEIVTVKKGDKCPDCNGTVQTAKAIEVGNTFPLGTFYAEKMGATFTAEDGTEKPLWFASYGIGTSRLMGTIVEISHDDDGIIWPESVSPFPAHLVNVADTTTEADALYQILVDAGVEALYDERVDVSAGEKFAEADLIGIPLRLVVSNKTIEKNVVEIKKRDKKEVEFLGHSELINLLTS